MQILLSQLHRFLVLCDQPCLSMCSLKPRDVDVPEGKLETVVFGFHGTVY